jgi:hypothetical protein
MTAALIVASWLVAGVLLALAGALIEQIRRMR